MDNSAHHNRTMLWVVNSVQGGINDCISKTKLHLQTTLNFKKIKKEIKRPDLYLFWSLIPRSLKSTETPLNLKKKKSITLISYISKQLTKWWWFSKTLRLPKYSSYPQVHITCRDLLFYAALCITLC